MSCDGKSKEMSLDVLATTVQEIWLRSGVPIISGLTGRAVQLLPPRPGGCDGGADCEGGEAVGESPYQERQQLEWAGRRGVPAWPDQPTHTGVSKYVECS